MTILGSVRTLFAGAIDYAGLYPPASLSLAETVRLYASYRRGPHAWALGRLVVPAAKLSELDALVAPLPDDGPWPLSVLVGDDLATGSWSRRLRVASVEVRAADTAAIDRIAEHLGGGPAAVYVEVPLAPDPRPWVQAVGDAGLRAKARTGGVTPEAIPAGRDVLAFLAAVVESGTEFKMTAGLHHALRGTYALTYEPHSVRTRMHGFVNVFVATALLVAGVPSASLEPLFEEADASAFTFEDDSVAWRGQRADDDTLVAARLLLGGFGSCSFEEPIEALESMGLLPAEVR